MALRPLAPGTEKVIESLLGQRKITSEVYPSNAIKTGFNSAGRDTYAAISPQLLAAPARPLEGAWFIRGTEKAPAPLDYDKLARYLEAFDYGIGWTMERSDVRKIAFDPSASPERRLAAVRLSSPFDHEYPFVPLALDPKQRVENPHLRAKIILDIPSKLIAANSKLQDQLNKALKEPDLEPVVQAALLLRVSEFSDSLVPEAQGILGDSSQPEVVRAAALKILIWEGKIRPAHQLKMALKLEQALEISHAAFMALPDEVVVQNKKEILLRAKALLTSPRLAAEKKLEILFKVRDFLDVEFLFKMIEEPKQSSVVAEGSVRCLWDRLDTLASQKRLWKISQDNKLSVLVRSTALNILGKNIETADKNGFPPVIEQTQEQEKLLLTFQGKAEPIEIRRACAGWIDWTQNAQRVKLAKRHMLDLKEDVHVRFELINMAWGKENRPDISKELAKIIQRAPREENANLQAEAIREAENLPEPKKLLPTITNILTREGAKREDPEFWRAVVKFYAEYASEPKPKLWTAFKNEKNNEGLRIQALMRLRLLHGRDQSVLNRECKALLKGGSSDKLKESALRLLWLNEDSELEDICATLLEGNNSAALKKTALRYLDSLKRR